MWCLLLNFNKIFKVLRNLKEYLKLYINIANHFALKHGSRNILESAYQKKNCADFAKRTAKFYINTKHLLYVIDFKLNE